MMYCDCPGAAALPSINVQNCPFDIGQVQKLIFRRTTAAAGIDGAESLADWQALKAAADDTKILVSPLVFNPAFAAGDENVYGENSNETPGGAGIKLGEWDSVFTGDFSQQVPEVITNLKKLECEKNLGVFFVAQDGRLFCRSVSVTSGGVTTTTYYPIPVSRFSLKSYTGGGLESPMRNEFTMKLPWNWYDGADLVQLNDGAADFSALDI